MNTVKFNSKVLLNYSLISNGNVFETTFDKEPVNIVIGESGLPQLIEVSLYGLKTGDKKEYSFDSNEVFGRYDEKKVLSTNIKTFKNYKDVKVGDIIESCEDDKSYFITILEVNDDEILIDLNHPLCNKNIQFKVEIIEIINDSEKL
tara:strand:+ start:5778 stop:6218 length:441 start_codon:yes stop_codon:yes gene_type:complete